MRIAALLDDSTERVLAHAALPGQDVQRMSDASHVVRSVLGRTCDVLVVDPDLLYDEALDALTVVFAQRIVPVLILGELSPRNARHIVRISELGVHEIVLLGEGDTVGLLAHKLAAVREHSVPAQILNHVAHRIRRVPVGLQAAAIGLFGNGALPRWVSGLARTSGLSRRSIDRWVARAGFDGAARLLEVARLARVWEPLVEQHLPVGVVAEMCGYDYPRLLTAHARRLVRANPAEFARTFSRRGYSERLTNLLVAETT